MSTKMPASKTSPIAPASAWRCSTAKGRVFIGRRIDGPEHVDATMPGRCRRAASIKGEDPWPAALRELYEETNIRSVEKLGEIDEWLCYDIPREIVGQAWKGKYRGQTQKWYALRFTGDDARSTSRIRPAATSRNSSSGAGSR